jgi:hypothetical protein
MGIYRLIYSYRIITSGVSHLFAPKSFIGWLVVLLTFPALNNGLAANTGYISVDGPARFSEK